MEVVLILGQNVDFNKYDFTNKFLIGVDKGALLAINNDISLDIAIGDFDSISKDELELVKSDSKQMKILNPIKDDTDTYEAIRYAYSISNNVSILGGISGHRIEHFIANILLFYKYPNIKIIDDYSYIYLIDSDLKKEELFNMDEYKYISFFALEPSVINLEGFIYPLTKYNLLVGDPLCISNEVINQGKLIIDSGKLLVIKSKSDLK